MNQIPVSAILSRYPAGDRTSSLAILEDIQAEYKHLPREALEETARYLNMYLSEVYQLATFFKAFSLKPKGEHIVKVCLGTACHVGGGARILDQLSRDLRIQAGGITPDGKFSLEAVRCVGACALSPVVLVNEEPHSKMTPTKASELLAKFGGATPPARRGRDRAKVAVAEAPKAKPPARARVDLSAVPPGGR
jgi:NADH-quinone oxidoreductase subunit E